jgi:endonuclease/exonuclease/phosphatase family metal-dependent hydrolase
MKSLKVMSYNIHKGFSINRQFTLAKIKDFIRQHHSDIVFLQEVVGENTKHKKKITEWPLDSQLEFLADSVWSHHAYGKNSIYDHGHHGNAVLSSWPILVYENIDISTNRLEDRGLMHVVISREGEQIHLLCAHLDLLEKGRQIQLKKIVQRVKEHIPDNEPLILAGDFNDWREKATDIFFNELGLVEVFHKLHGEHALTFPSRKPHLPLDRIYVRGFEPLTARCLTTNSLSELSDHGAMIAEISRPLNLAAAALPKPETP